MDRMELVKALRADTEVHYNCCQSVLIPFCDCCGIDRETARRLGAHFGSGMRYGGACGALTGALMVLGMAGKDQAAAEAVLDHFRTCRASTDCQILLQKAEEEGIPRKTHCDALVYEIVALVERLL